jgi:para-nitrobenzyl esterase
MGCAGTDAEQVACLRALPADAIQAGPIIPPMLRVIDDGQFVTGDVALTIEKKGAGVPVIVGSNREEQSFAYIDNPDFPDTEQTLEDTVRADVPTLADQLLPLYPVSDYDSPLWALVAVESDVAYTCGVRRFADVAASAKAAAPVWRYLFTYAPDELRAQHGAELDPLFGAHPPGDPEYALSELLKTTWIRFAATGDPNGPGTPDWPQHTAANDNFLVLDDPPSLGAAYHDAACDLIVPAY